MHSSSVQSRAVKILLLLAAVGIVVYGGLAFGQGNRRIVAIVQPLCGNGIKEAGEECDDGNADNTDACTTSCTKARCGDEYVWKGVEDCDPPWVGQCSAFCIDPRVNHSASSNRMVRAHCGNGIVEASQGEECDMGA